MINRHRVYKLCLSFQLDSNLTTLQSDLAEAADEGEAEDGDNAEG